MKTFIALLIVAGIASTQALCPNSCSGHGTCVADPKDSCQCYTRLETTHEYGKAETVPAWTGADCSLRTCPSGYAGQLPHKTTKTISKSSNAPVKVNAIANQANVSTNVKPPSLYISLSNNVLIIILQVNVSQVSMVKVADAAHAQMIVMATVFAKAWRNSQRTTFHLIYMKI